MATGFQPATRDGARERAALAEALTSPDLLRRVADTVAIMPYEFELFPDGSFRCVEFLGLESLLGPLPEGVAPEAAYDAAVHPDDRAVYDSAAGPLQRGETVEIEYRLMGTDGKTRWVLDRMRPVRDADGRVLVAGMAADITARKYADEALAEAQQLAFRALHDPLTNLPNRTSFQEYLCRAIDRAGASERGVAVLFVDLDDFKLINDSYGHAAGDVLLQAVSDRLVKATRAGDVVARHGGDEFLILVPDLSPTDGHELDPEGALRHAERIAARILRELQHPFRVALVEVYVTASVGISLFPFDADDAETLLKHSDIAMYAAKAAGRNAHRPYALVHDTARQQLEMAGRLHRAVSDAQGLVLHYQPILDLASGVISGVEALVRWEDPEQGLVLPERFIPLAERIGLIGAISDWVISEACGQAARWRQGGIDIDMSINLSPVYCEREGIRRLLGAVKRFRLDPARLMIEITESALMTRDWRTIAPYLSELRQKGIRLALDDFGTGHSSLGRLHRSWVSTLKIDRSFVADLPSQEHAGALVMSIVQLAGNLGLDTIAEGVETDAQRRALLAMGCTAGQGFYFSQPVPAQDIEHLFSGSTAGRVPLRGLHRGFGSSAAHPLGAEPIAPRPIAGLGGHVAPAGS